jgi:group I intron endonuclease
MSVNNQTRIVGIYKITCVPNGKIYIGSSVDVHRRWGLHRTHLNTGNHNNKYLLRAFEKYGKESFVWEIIEECSEDILWEREQHYLDTLQPFNEKGYNSARVVKAPMTGRKHTLEDRQKMSRVQKARNYKHTEEWKLANSLRNKGKKRSLEASAKTAAKLKGRKFTEEHKAKIKKHASSPERIKEKSERMKKVWAAVRLGKDCYVYMIAVYAVRCGIVLSKLWKGTIISEQDRLNKSKAQLKPELRKQKSEDHKKRWEGWYKEMNKFFFLIAWHALRCGIKL